MEHSTAIMEDAGRATEGASIKHEAEINDAEANDSRQNNYGRRKRKGNFQDRSSQGARGGRRGGGRNNGKRHKKGDLGRGEYFASNPDKRQKTNASREKRLDGNGPQYAAQFTQEEIAAEERRPKRKVAVMIGYSGTGYKGMQISANQRTIEGDLFRAFVAAGAISKANADDPKKASLVRCARTDKSVHAAGNMISLKLIVEDGDIVEKINEQLDVVSGGQIKVWGIERTIGSFSCYQACDSRWYEYLIPSYAFLPPHPSSWLAKKLEALADEAGDRVGFEDRRNDVMGFWDSAEIEHIQPLLESIDEDIRQDVVKALRGEDEADAVAVGEDDVDGEGVVRAEASVNGDDDGADADAVLRSEKTEEAAIIINEASTIESTAVEDEAGQEDGWVLVPDEVLTQTEETIDTNAVNAPTNEQGEQAAITIDPTPGQLLASNAQQPSPADLDRTLRLREATKRLRHAYTTAKRQYRIPPSRIARIQEALNCFIGTHNFHNYTIQKTFRDPSAKRHIKSFVVNPAPILIGEGMPEEEKGEWLSLKIHGQSFMMHQIRKMIGMITLLIRCNSMLASLKDSLTASQYSIPKVPGLGLLLERPVFDSYNDIQAPKHGRERLDFGKYEAEMEQFKQREIYERIYREEGERNEFAKFFNHVDEFRGGAFLWVSSMGLKAVEKARAGSRQEGVDRSSAGDD